MKPDLDVQESPAPRALNDPSSSSSALSNPDPDSNSDLSPLETEVIDLFVEISRVLGQPRSLAEIYGLLFIANRPMSMDDLIARLRLSKGSASQGLKYLRNLGAVRTVYVPADRRVHYEAVAELRTLGTKFLREQMLPRLDDGLVRMNRISALAQKLPAQSRGQVVSRVTMLQSWGKKTRRSLPLVLKLLGG